MIRVYTCNGRVSVSSTKYNDENKALTMYANKILKTDFHFSLFRLLNCTVFI